MGYFRSWLFTEDAYLPTDIESCGVFVCGLLPVRSRAVYHLCSTKPKGFHAKGQSIHQMTSFASFSDLMLKSISIVGVAIRHRHMAWVSWPFKELINIWGYRVDDAKLSTKHFVIQIYFCNNVAKTPMLNRFSKEWQGFQKPKKFWCSNDGTLTGTHNRNHWF